MKHFPTDTLVTLTADAAEMFPALANRILRVVDTRGTRQVSYRCAPLELVGGNWLPNCSEAGEFFADEIRSYH